MVLPSMASPEVPLTNVDDSRSTPECGQDDDYDSNLINVCPDKKYGYKMGLVKIWRGRDEDEELVIRFAIMKKDSLDRDTGNGETCQTRENYVRITGQNESSNSSPRRKLL
jgi:hypothetical protein